MGCAARKAGTFSHIFSTRKFLEKWFVDRISIIPDIQAGTSRPCVCSVPRAYDRIYKPPILEITIISPQSKYRKKGKKEDMENETKTKTGVKSSLYDAGGLSTGTPDYDDVILLTDKLKAINPSLPNSSCVKEVATQFGLMPFGSPLSLPNSASKACAKFRYYPPFPFQATEDSISYNVKCISDMKNLCVYYENYMKML